MPRTLPLAAVAGLGLLTAAASAHEGSASDHLNIGYYFGHDGSFEAPADPPEPPTLLVDTHPWELGGLVFDFLEPVSGLLEGWQTTLPGFDTLPVDEQEFGGHGFYSWIDPAYDLGTPNVMLHVVDHHPDLQILSPFTLEPLPESSFLGVDFHLHAIFFVDASADLQPGEILTATFFLSDAIGHLEDSEPFTLRFSRPLCDEDIDADGMVGSTDLLALLAAWGTDDAFADVDDNGVVETADLLQLLSVWGPCAG